VQENCQLKIDVLDGDAVLELHSQLLPVYAEVYAHLLSDPFSTETRYWERLQSYASRDGFSAVTGYLGNTLIGYSFGFTLPNRARWWKGFLGEVEQDELSENGRRTFALCELAVRQPWRRCGYAGALHNVLLQNRHEQRATLLVRPDNAPARAAYISWGWYEIGKLQPFPDAPVFDAMMLDLSLRERHAWQRAITPARHQE
jgi:GNAT superfamily N-acetyltransferase